MIFDRACAFAEKNPSVKMPMLKKAAVFLVDLDDFREAGSVEKLSDLDDFAARLFLPFDPVWVEDSHGAGGLLLSCDPFECEFDERERAIEKLREEQDVGEVHQSLSAWMFVRIRTEDGKPVYSSDGVRAEFMTSYGHVIPWTERATGKLRLRFAHAHIGISDSRGNGAEKNIDNLNELEMRLLHKVGSSGWAIGVGCLYTINSPKKWIVSREHIHARPVQKGKIARSDQRVRFIIVSEDEIERVIRDPNPANVGVYADRRPHRRRAHSHLLKSERFTWKRGQRVFVKACWVGPETAEYGGERYRVMLDL